MRYISAANASFSLAAARSAPSDSVRQARRVPWGGGSAWQRTAATKVNLSALSFSYATVGRVYIDQYPLSFPPGNRGTVTPLLRDYILIAPLLLVDRNERTILRRFSYEQNEDFSNFCQCLEDG